MSEYVTVEPESTENPDVMELFINQLLTRDEEEIYDNRADGETGSPLASTLFFAVEGIKALRIYPDYLVITRDPAIDWALLLDDIRDTLRDFYL
ncbi:MAG: NifU N-terminal domain-containing protein [Aggregatilineales bacterium]